MRVPFQLASPPGCHITHIPKGNLVLCTKLTFFVQWHFLLFRPWVFSRGLGCGARRRPACTLRCKCGPWTRSVASALGVQSHENRQVSTGRHSERLEPSRRMQTHTVKTNPTGFPNAADGMHKLPGHLVLLLSCSCSFSSALALVLVLVLECFCLRARARVLECW